MTARAQIKEMSDAVTQPRSSMKAGNSAPVAMVCASSLTGTHAPPRKFVVADFVPDRTVTLFTGDGGVGKSLAALHMAVSVSMGRPWLSLATQRGPAVFLTAEDELDEVHRRLEAICAYERISIGDLEALHILPLAGRDALLAVPDRERGTMKPTKLFEKVSGDLAQIKPKLTVFDTLADTFGGEENNRAQARSFVGLLRGLSIETDMASLVLAHPSLSGLASGSGSSGSTGWANSVRSRFYMERPKRPKPDDGEDEEPDDDARILTVKKANYGPVGLVLELRWSDGVFVQDDGELCPTREEAREVRANAADEIFLGLLRKFNEQGRRISPSPSTIYAPAVFEKDPDADGFRKKVLAAAMERLLQARSIHVAEDGPPSKRRQQLLVGPPPDGL